MQPYHDDNIDFSNTNTHAIRILWLFVFLMVLQGLDLRLNYFQEWEDDTSQIGMGG